MVIVIDRLDLIRETNPGALKVLDYGCERAIIGKRYTYFMTLQRAGQDANHQRFSHYSETEDPVIRCVERKESCFMAWGHAAGREIRPPLLEATVAPVYGQDLSVSGALLISKPSAESIDLPSPDSLARHIA